MKLPKRNIQQINILLALLILLSGLYPFLMVQQAHATTALQSAMVRFDRLKASTATTATVCAKTSTTNGTEANVAITFPAGFTLGAFGTFTVSTTSTGWPTGAAAWPGIGTATAKSNQIVTFPSSDLTTNTLYCFNITGGITTPAAANDLVGNIETQTAGNAGIDRSDFATSIISNDQITVTASVSATMTFSLSSNTAALGSLTTSAIAAASAINATFSTNAASGVIGWVKSATGSLSSAATGATITSPGTINATPETLATGTSGYVLDVDTNTNGTAGTGTVTIDPEYNYTGTVNATNGGGGHLDTVLEPIFTTNGTHASGIVNLIPRAAISSVQGAANDYTDTLTVVAAGRF